MTYDIVIIINIIIVNIILFNNKFDENILKCYKFGQHSA